MLAVSGELPTGDDWTYELKWDGVRALAVVRSGQIHLYARSGTEITVAYPELGGLAAAVTDAVGEDGETLLDGEVVVLDDAGHPSFSALAERMHVRDPERAAHLADTVPVTYMIFDLLVRGGTDLTHQPYQQRREQLEELGLAGPHWLVPPSFSDGPATMAAAIEHTLEGVVAKRRSSPYRPGTRSPDWVKVKQEETGDFVVGGWRSGARRLGALLVGAPADDGRLVFQGRVGGGISGAAEESLLAALQPLVIDESPFAGPVPPPDARGAVWVRPQVVVEVRYAQRTPDGRLRFPRFLRQRPDKTPDEADRAPTLPPGPPSVVSQLEPGDTRVRVDNRLLKLSNLDKVLYPITGFTKGEVIDYYARVAPVLLPHLRDRALTRIRFPDGVDEPSFFEKNRPPGTPHWVHTETLTVPSSTRGRETLDYVVADDLATLVWLANLAALELHTRQWRIGADGPDLLVVDLDPGPPAGLAECAQVALRLRDRLAADGLTAYAKTSGRKGMQLYCAISARQPAEVVTGYLRRIATELAREDPKRITARMTRRLRPGKVFIDWSQNIASKTTVAPYSLRAEPIPSVSTPVSWEEVAAGQLGRFSPEQVLRRVDEQGDLFAPLLQPGPPVPEE